jgi:hypothetical protein
MARKKSKRSKSGNRVKVGIGEKFEKDIEKYLSFEGIDFAVPTTYDDMLRLGRFHTRMLAMSLGMFADEEQLANFMLLNTENQAVVVYGELQRRGWRQ